MAEDLQSMGDRIEPRTVDHLNGRELFAKVPDRGRVGLQSRFLKGFDEVHEETEEEGAGELLAALVKSRVARHHPGKQAFPFHPGPAQQVVQGRRRLDDDRQPEPSQRVKRPVALPFLVAEVLEHLPTGGFAEMVVQERHHGRQTERLLPSLHSSSPTIPSLSRTRGKERGEADDLSASSDKS
jgi:hypothetical protein